MKKETYEKYNFQGFQGLYEKKMNSLLLKTSRDGEQETEEEKEEENMVNEMSNSTSAHLKFVKKNLRTPKCAR